jgi:hypothetical protein
VQLALLVPQVLLDLKVCREIQALQVLLVQLDLKALLVPLALPEQMEQLD